MPPAPRFARIKLRSLQLLRIVSTVLTFALVSNSVAVAAPPDAAKQKQKLIARGIGNTVRVTETSGTTVTGTLISVDDTTFKVMPRKAAEAVTVAYADVSSIHGGGLSTRAQVGIGITILVLVALGVVGTRI